MSSSPLAIAEAGFLAPVSWPADQVLPAAAWATSTPQWFPKRGRPKRPKPILEQIVGWEHLQTLDRHLHILHDAKTHPNRVLHDDQVLVACLLGFFNPTVRSLRTLEDLSAFPKVQRELDLERVCKSTFSDAARDFATHRLGGLVKELSRHVSHLKAQDPSLDCILKKIIAADGSMFRIAADVAWALHLTKSNGQSLGQVRLNLQFNVLDGLPEAFSVSGQSEGSEPHAFIKDIVPDSLLLIDRNFGCFAFLDAALLARCDVVLRLKSDIKFQATEARELSPEDQAAGVQSDALGFLPGTRNSRAPTGQFRELVLTDPLTGKSIRVLTTLLDVPARIIGLLYRYRWQIELFFRWLKVWANFEHLISESPNGLSLQFYVAVIGVLLMHIRTGRQMSKYSYNALALVAAGYGTLEDALKILARRERERELEKARRDRKKAPKNQA